jgi:low temperature requirement protein LtrA
MATTLLFLTKVRQSYRVLCWTLFISRFWLGIQYLLTTAFCSTRQNRHLRLIKPLSFNTLVFLVAGAAYGGLYGAFSDSKKDVTGAIAGLYVIIVLELVCALAISSIWTTLSFRATHIGERLGLLGLIIIGEGVIGTTKTIVRIMGKNGVYVEGCALIFCIIHILVRTWHFFLFDSSMAADQGF